MGVTKIQIYCKGDLKCQFHCIHARRKGKIGVRWVNFLAIFVRGRLFPIFEPKGIKIGIECQNENSVVHLLY